MEIGEGNRRAPWDLEVASFEGTLMSARQMFLGSLYILLG